MNILKAVVELVTTDIFSALYLYLVFDISLAASHQKMNHLCLLTYMIPTPSIERGKQGMREGKHFVNPTGLRSLYLIVC